jgi:hypothetical protein
MMKTMLFFLVVFFPVYCGITGFAGKNPAPEWKTTVTKLTATQYRVDFIASIPDGYYIYAYNCRNDETDASIPCLHFTFDSSDVLQVDSIADRSTLFTNNQNLQIYRSQAEVSVFVTKFELQKKKPFIGQLHYTECKVGCETKEPYTFKLKF